MEGKFTKTLLISTAALGLCVAASGVAADKTDAKSYAKVTSNRTLTTAPETRNVTFTGSNALYDKAGTLRGARKVATTTTLQGLAASNSSQKNVRAYRVATTDRGSVYYKVVSFDKTYRGWIYGGKSSANFGGGINTYQTFKQGTPTAEQTSGEYKIANEGTANDGKTVTYKQPAWTQYKIGRQIMDSTPYKDTTFKIDQVGTRTRENDQWVHITATDTTKSAANGWILMSALTKGETKPTETKRAFQNIVLNTQALEGVDGKAHDTTKGEDIITQGAYLYSNKAEVGGLMANLKESALNRISGKTGETVPDADIVKALEDYGLTDFYVVYWRGGPVAGVGKSFIKDSAIRPVMGIQHEIWHYQLKNLTGDRKVDSKNLEANYTVTKKKLRVPRVGVTPQQWGRIFGNIWYPK